MTNTAYLVEIIDGADFERVLAARIALDYTRAHLWARERRDAFRKARVEEGEKDEMFVQAIYDKVTKIEVV